MPEKPILFSGPMVRAIFEGRKTQTRRVVKGGNAIARTATSAEWDAERHSYDMARFNEWGPARGGALVRMASSGSVCFMPAPYAPGDVLWVRETWSPFLRGDGADGWVNLIQYAADGLEREVPAEHVEWFDARCERGWLKRPSIHMPRWAARLFLRVTDVRVERVQGISGVDAVAEGCGAGVADYELMHYGGYKKARREFRTLWDSLNAPRGYGWDANPWVWVYTFERERPHA